MLHLTGYLISSATALWISEFESGMWKIIYLWAPCGLSWDLNSIWIAVMACCCWRGCGPAWSLEQALIITELFCEVIRRAWRLNTGKLKCSRRFSLFCLVVTGTSDLESLWYHAPVRKGVHLSPATNYQMIYFSFDLTLIWVNTVEVEGVASCWQSPEFFFFW